MNVAANMLGMDNAATPIGIKAIKELQTLNGQKDTASNAMCMFLALNTSSLTLLPASIIAFRISAHSARPTEIFVPILIATGCGKIMAIVSCKIFERFSPDTPSASEIETSSEVVVSNEGVQQ
jgi:spore maturation protein A